MTQTSNLEGSSLFPAEVAESSLDLAGLDLPSEAAPAGGGFLGHRLAAWTADAFSWLTDVQLPRVWIFRGNSRIPALPAHIEEARLLRYLDGELPPAERDDVTRHLRGCWSCRGRLRELRDHIEAFLSEREHCMPDLSSASPERVCELRRRLTHRLEQSPADDPALTRPQRE